MLQSFTTATRTDYLYGLNRLATLHGSTRTWYVHDALGSVRRTVTDAGVPLGVVQYDPWGSVESGTVPTFGFTGELQQGGDVYLRARWYRTGQGRFATFRWRTSESWDTIPYSHHPYVYALGNPVLYTDPAGTYAIANPDGGGGSGSGDPRELICGPRPVSNPILGSQYYCNERTHHWEEIVAGTVYVPGASNAIKFVAAACISPFAYFGKGFRKFAPFDR